MMNKKTNTLLFILGGTIFNILVTVICFLAFLAIYGRIYHLFPESSSSVAMPIIFVASIALSFLVYRIVVRIIIKTVDINKYFDPIFGPRGGSRPQK